MRVDIFYASMTPEKRALVDLLGSLCYSSYPFASFMLIISWPYVANSWKLLESFTGSGRSAAGFLLKSLILVMPALLLGQATINISDAWKTLRYMILQIDTPLKLGFLSQRKMFARVPLSGGR